jgi:hypothetical protein
MLFCVLVGVVHGLFTPLLLPHPSHLRATTFFLLARVIPYTFAAFECACIWGYWAGVEWTRILVLIDCVLEIFALHRFPATYHRYPSMALLEIGKACLAIFLFWYLFRPQVRAWFNGSSTGKSPDGPGTPATHAPPAA